MPITHREAQQAVYNLPLNPSRAHEMVARRAGKPVPPWLEVVWGVLSQVGHSDLLKQVSELPSLVEEAKAFAGMLPAHGVPEPQGPDELLAVSPAERLRQVQALLEVRLTGRGIGPTYVGGEDPAQQELQMRLWRAQADLAIKLQSGPDTSAALRALAQAPQHGRAEGQPLCLPVLLVAEVKRGEWQGRLATLRLWRWHCPPAAGEAAQRARLHLLPTLAQACVPLTQGFAQSLQTVAHWLRSQVTLKAATDTALVWDLTPEKDSVHLLAGPSASAATALAGAWLLRDHLDPKWRNPLLGTPLYLNLQCELWEAGAKTLLANRAHLLAAMLWLRLGQELDGPAGQQAFRANGMVSENEARTARAFAERPGHPSEFPLEGWLLKSLFAQAKAQWMSAPDTSAEFRGQVSLSWTIVQRNLMNAGLPRDQLDQWRKAVAALGLARWEDTAGQAQFQFEHQVFGEWLASAALFTTGANTGPGGGRLPGEQPMPEHWSAEALAQLAQDLAPLPLARSAEDELEAQRQHAREAWSDPRLDELLAEWRWYGLRLPLSELESSLEEARGLPADGCNMLELYQRRDVGFIQIDAAADQGAWHFGNFGDFLAKNGTITLAAGVHHWSADRAAWARICLDEAVWPKFREAAQWNMSARVGNEQTRALWAMGRLSLPPPGPLDDIMPLALDGLGDEALLAWLAWLAEQGPWALLSTSLVRSRDRLRQWAKRGNAQAAAVDALWSTSSHRLLAVVNDAGTVEADLPEPDVRRIVGGADPRQRLQAGELLGAQGEPGSPEGDHLRFERSGSGLQLREPHWLPVGGPSQLFRLGEANCGQGDLPLLWLGNGPGLPELPAFQIAQMSVTVAEYNCFIKAGGYGSDKAPVPIWWQAAGPLAVQWLQDRRAQGAALQPSTWGNTDFDNPLQPVTGVTWFEAMAYCAWAGEEVFADRLARLHSGAGGHRWILRLPTEWEWEAAQRGPYDGGPPLPWPGHGPLKGQDDAPWAMLFNHASTGWGRPSPVGCWGASRSPLGLLDGAGTPIT